MAIWTPTNKTEKADLIKDLKRMADSIDDEKVQKETGKRLITSEEATKLAGLENYDDTKLNKKIEELEEQNKQLLKDHKPIPFNSSSNHLVDTGELPMPISINGGIEQDTREGYNKLGFEDGSETLNGVTCTRTNGKIILNGTATAVTKFFIPLIETFGVPANNSITLQAFNPIAFTGTEGNLRLRVSDTNFVEQAVLNIANINSSGNFILNNSADFEVAYLLIRIENGVTLSNFELNPQAMLVTDTTKPYEQYGQMPSLAFPSEVKGVSGHYDNVVENKQLFNGKWELGDINSSTGNNANSSASIRSVDFIKITPDSKYTVSRQDVTNGKFRFYDKDKNYIGYINKGGGGLKQAQKLVFIPPNNCYYMKFVIDISNLNYQLQLELGDTATPIVEHQEQLLPIDIPTGQVWYSGKPYKENGKWYRDVKSVKLPFNNTIFGSPALVTSYIKSNLVGLVASIKPSENQYAIGSNIYSNIFKNKKLLGASDTTSEESVRNSRGIATHSGGNSQIVISLEKKELENANIDITNASAIFNWLVAQDFYVVLEELKNPTIEEITDTTLISQLEALEKAHSYYEVTNINSYRPTEDVAEMKLSGNALMSNDIRMSKIENAILSIGGI